MYWNPNYESFGAPQGWVCPKCGRVYSPMTPSCFHCGNGGVVITDKTTPPPTTNDSEWWKEYLKQSQTGKTVNDNPSITTATTTSNPNVKLTAWNSSTTCEQNCENCDKYETSCFGGVETTSSRAIISHRKPPDIYYPTNVSLNIAPCNECMKDWLEAFNEQFK